MVVPQLVSPDQAQRLRDFFSGAGYEEKTLSKALDKVELPSAHLRNLPRLLNRTQEPNRLNTLLRWFWVGVEQPAAAVAAFVPGPIVDLLVESGLLSRRGDQLVPQAMFVPFEGFLVASHHTSRIDSGDPDLVLWPNPTTRLLLRYLIPRPSRQTLDLGTGTGLLAMVAAGHSRNVVATDLNPKAVEFARFNACLNGVKNIECLTGDGFSPVARRKFDLIFSNPPFFITPARDFLFCDNSMELDQMCRQFVKQAPQYLEPGGYFQMVCEWVQIRGQDWHDRLGEWFRDTGCDGWVWKGSTTNPGEYAQLRIAEVTNSSECDAQFFDEYMAYYRQRSVEAIHKGLITLRLRPGKNWVLMQDIDDAPRKPFGDAIEHRFAARDFLAAHATDEQMLPLKLRISPDARLEQVFEPSEDGWKPTPLNLKLVRGLPSSVGVQPLVAQFLAFLNGSRTLGEAIHALNAKVGEAPELVTKECLEVSRKLVESGFLMW